MSAVAHHLEVSRSTVSRLLQEARDQGIVQITVNSPMEDGGPITTELERTFGVHVHVVPTLQADSALNRLNAVASAAAGRLTDLMGPGKTLGIAWGNTTSALVQALQPSPQPGSRVVQINGAANALDPGTLYADSIISTAAAAFEATAIHFPVPAFFDYPETRRALWRERSIRNVLGAIADCDVALFSVGAMDPQLPSYVYSGGYLSKKELLQANQDGVVGDICTVLIREDGSSNMPLNERASGPAPAALRKVPVRLCAVAGVAKAAPLLGALRAGVITHLVVDSELARAVMRRHRSSGQPA